MKTSAEAWVQVVRTGVVKPVQGAGALVLESFSGIKNSVQQLEQRLDAETAARHTLEQRLDEETATRQAAVKRLEEFNLVLANYMAEMQNLMKEKDILTRDKDRIYQAQSILNDCQVCMDRPRTMKLAPCGHMATCRDCTERIMSQNGKCPLCRRPVIRFDETYLS